MLSFVTTHTHNCVVQFLLYACHNCVPADLSPAGRKGSFIGVRRLAREEIPLPGADPPPTNEAVAQAVQEKVAVSF